MANDIGWGAGASNNDIGWGTGFDNEKREFTYLIKIQ
jgi:hypothetical protein